MRLRPIIMTTMSTILAALPLAMATGAGAAGRWHIGLVVINGLMLSTLLTLFLVPLIYTMLAELRWRGPVRQVKETDRPEVVALKPTQS